MKTKEYLVLVAICLFTISSNEIITAGSLRGNLILSLQEPQTPPTATEMSKRETEWMKKDLTLTAAQLPKVDSLNYAYAQKMIDARKNSGDDREQRRADMISLRDKKKVELAKILTPDQMKQYDISAQEHRGRMGGGGNRPPQN